MGVAALTDGIRLVFRDGQFSKAHSDDFSMTGLTLSVDGSQLRVADYTVIKKPIYFLHEQMNAASVVQSIVHHITLGIHSQMTICEAYITESSVMYHNRVQMQMDVGAGAVLQYYRLQQESNMAMHEVESCINQAKDSQVTACYIDLGAHEATQTLRFCFQQQNACANIFGLYRGSNTQMLRSRIFVEHAVSQCCSKQIIRGVLSDSAQIDFQGKITVHPGARKTQAYLNNRNLLLSEQAQVSTKPELQIDSDDVQCAHGATVGCLDVDALFYLRARGIPETQARALLTRAFMQDALEGISHVQIHSYAQSLVNHDVL